MDEREREVGVGWTHWIVKYNPFHCSSSSVENLPSSRSFNEGKVLKIPSSKEGRKVSRIVSTLVFSLM